MSSTLVFSSIDLLASILSAFFLVSISFSAFLLSMICSLSSVSIFWKASYLSRFLFSYSSNLNFSSVFFSSNFYFSSSRRVTLAILGGPRFFILGGERERCRGETSMSNVFEPSPGFCSTILDALFSFSLLMSLRTSGRHRKHCILSV